MQAFPGCARRLVVPFVLSAVLAVAVACGGTPGRPEAFSPVWSPDGRMLAFVVDPAPRDGCAYGSCVLTREEVWVVRADGGGARRLARGTAPSWSPDGRTLAFIWTGTDEDDDRAGIATIRADGTGLRQLTSLLSQPNRRGPSWSPDGSRIAFASWGWFTGRNRLYVMNADGSDLHRLTRVEAYDAAWSPDGAAIAFAGLDALYTIAPDGSRLRRVATPEDGLGWSLAWARDGGRIVFDAGSGFGVVDANGRVVLAPGRRVLGDPGTQEGWATLSPDGRRLTFERTDEDTTEVYVANADGTGARPVAPGFGPAWSPDGRRIAFSHDGAVLVVQPDRGGALDLTTGGLEGAT